MTFRDQVVWITGASSGIGEALALAFAREGAHLVLSARRAEALERVATACRGQAASVWALPMDMTDLAGMQAKASEVLGRLGRVDWLIHNAGVSQRSRAIETAIEVDEKLIRTNYLGPVALTKAVLPSMVQAHRGGFVVVSSLVGKFGTPMRSGYSGSKHALHGFFDSLRAEHHGDGIRVTLVCPGFVATDVSMHALSGNGSAYGQMDEATAQGITPAVCAERIVKAVRQGREEVNVGGREVRGVLIKRLFPRLFSRLIRRAKVT